MSEHDDESPPDMSVREPRKPKPRPQGTSGAAAPLERTLELDDVVTADV